MKENPNEFKIINKNERIKWLNMVADRDKEIAKLKEELKNCPTIEDLYPIQIIDAENKLKISILEKALHLACADICSRYFDSERQDEIILHYANNFKNTAKEELKCQK